MGTFQNETKKKGVSHTVETREENKGCSMGYGDKNGTMRSTAAIMSTKMFNKVSHSATTVVLVNECKTSKLCSCCQETMRRLSKNKVG